MGYAEDVGDNRVVLQSHSSLAGIPSPIGMSVLRDIESNMCCTRISNLDYFSKSHDCNVIFWFTKCS